MSRIAWPLAFALALATAFAGAAGCSATCTAPEGAETPAGDAAAAGDAATAELEIPTITAEEWLAIAGAPDAPLLLDTRTPEEFAAGHIPGAVLLPHDQVAARWREVGLDPSRPVVVYCRSGRRAKIAERVLIAELGFADVRHLEGDWLDWTAQGRAVASGE